MDDSPHTPDPWPGPRREPSRWLPMRRRALPPGTASPDAAPCRPFAWQHGPTLLILDRDRAGWVLAEFRFDDRACRYEEFRRARYRWQREAAGALLGRVLAAGEEVADGAALRLLGWNAPDGPARD